MEIKEIIKDEINHYEEINKRKIQELKESKDRFQKELLETHIVMNNTSIAALITLLKRIERGE